MEEDPILTQTSPTRGDALRLADILGCSGAHQMGEGWHPCESHEALLILINDGIAAYREHVGREAAKAKRQGKSRRTAVMWVAPPKRKKRKRMKPKKRWENLGEHGVPSIQGGPPGITSGKDGYTGEKAVVAVLLPTDSAKEFIQKNGLPFEELHLTLGYFNKPSQAPPSLEEDLVGWAKTVASHCGPLTMKVNGIAEIGDAEPPAAVMMLESAKLMELREELDQGMRSAALDRTHPGFLPHMTLGYGLSLDKLDVEGNVIFDHIAIWWGDHHYVFPLVGEKY